ncbi:hypothetical protein ACTA71_006644 [Dictyostelium dimigraforme]
MVQLKIKFENRESALSSTTTLNGIRWFSNGNKGEDKDILDGEMTIQWFYIRTCLLDEKWYCFAFKLWVLNSFFPLSKPQFKSLTLHFQENVGESYKYYFPIQIYNYILQGDVVVSLNLVQLLLYHKPGDVGQLLLKTHPGYIVKTYSSPNEDSDEEEPPLPVVSMKIRNSTC